MLFAVLSPKKISGNLCWSPEISCSRLVFYFTVHLTGSGSFCLQVSHIDGKEVGGKAPEILKALQDGLVKECEEECGV